MNEKKKSMLKKVDNSKMVQNLEEVKKLGKEMEAAKTKQELKEDKLSPDPKQ